MKKYVVSNVFLMALFVVMSLSSCGGSKTLVLPRAVNTVNAVGLSELNLERNDYQILDRITAEASVVYKETSGTVKLSDDAGECEVTYKKTPMGLTMRKFKGFFKMGYLHNDYSSVNYNNPEEFARRLAIYRLINMSNEMGADGIVEPVISTNIAQEGKNTIIFKTTVSGKIVKLNTNN